MKRNLVITGNIKFAAIDSSVYRLEKGEFFSIKGVKGNISFLTLDTTGITFEFVGTVEDVKAGRENLPKDLMPSKMDYILANRGNKLFYEITLTIIGLIYSAYLFFKSHR